MRQPFDDVDKTDVLYRVIPIYWVEEGVVSSQSFRPMPDDDELLSASDSSMVSAVCAYNKYARDPDGERPVGVLGITVCECNAQGLGVRSDPQPGQPEHALIDFSDCVSRNSIHKKSQKLRDKAVGRGWFHGPFFRCEV